ncbi:MAG: putative metal-dependent hydrolase [Acidobacteriota bacterium]|nr:putative metal-dependent hydrolase [Acidobacteriota bacterium]
MDPRYPTGRFTFDPAITSEKRAAWVATIGSFPDELKAALATIPANRLDTPYREGGWTARQVVHHVADSHMNAHIRLRLALTEHEPALKPYAEDRWAELEDARTADPAVSVGILTGLHHRWHALLGSLSPADFARPAYHPEHGAITVDWLVQLYGWHGRHHIGHLRLIGR